EKSNKDEKWMEARAPEKIGDAPFFKSSQNPAQSYRMNDITYKMLAPYGIVARQYTTKDGKVFDVVLIASESRASFHDPRICFSGSGWTISDQHTVDVPTKTRGVVPVMIVSMENGEKRNQLAAFFYRGPSGFQASTRGLKWDM